MRVKLLTIMAGPDGNYAPGEHDFPEDEALALIQGGFAVPIHEGEPEQTAQEPPEETTAAVAKRVSKPRKL